MQYSRVLFVMILGGSTVMAASQGQQQQQSSSQADKRMAVMCDHAAPPAGTHWVCNDRNDPCNCRLENEGGRLSPDDDGGPRFHTPEPQASGKISVSDFEKIMTALAAARNEGNAAQAADLFTENAVYGNPGSGPTHKGRAALRKLFSRASVQPRKFEWHHLLFNEPDQVGAGEFTLEGGRRYHGMAIVKIENGRISHWREYPVSSRLNWEEFTSENRF